MPRQHLWETKLAAFLHDPPDHALGNPENSPASPRSWGTVAPDETKIDHAAVDAADAFTTAADRAGLPQKKETRSGQNRQQTLFKHPLSSSDYGLDSEKLLASSAQLHDLLVQTARELAADDPKTRFFLLWRSWMENTAQSPKLPAASSLAFLPADKDIPDHSIWLHNTAASALAGCTANGPLQPALLLFQLGGVQEFIAQARSTRDLWSGSYLLSWLMAHAMKAISDEVGPDAIIFPNLRGNGIFDALHRDSAYATQTSSGGKTEPVWKHLVAQKNRTGTHGVESGATPAAQWLLTPTLPNRFLAVLPAEQAESLAHAAAIAMQRELNTIGKAVWTWLAQEANAAGCPDVQNWRQRWNTQLGSFLQISWAVQPWLDRQQCLQEMKNLPINRQTDKKAERTPLETLELTLQLAEAQIDPAAAGTAPANPGLLWSAHYALADAKLAARRNTRDFSAWENPWPEASLKDSLSGHEEIIGDERFWQHLQRRHGNLFTSTGHAYGAMNLLKRLWCRDDQVPYLRDRLGLSSKDYGQALGCESTRDIARNNSRRGNYIAILAMDGDEMGKWVSGEKTPLLLNQCSTAIRNIIKPILDKNKCADLRRLLSPSYHLQFSEALANFSTYLARPVVEAFGGQLIYAGGDDVLAMLPADQAIACARSLRQLFCGLEPGEGLSIQFKPEAPGFIKPRGGQPLVVPGEKADVSIGLAIGHHALPLQKLVQEAQLAERRAKQEYGRGALAFSLYKRSGETIAWGCKWTSQALSLMTLLCELSPLPASSAATGQQRNANTAGLSERFPYALAELLGAYQLQRKPWPIPPTTMREIIMREVNHVISRQGQTLVSRAHQNADDAQKLMDLRAQIAEWLDECVAGEIQAGTASPSCCGSFADFIQPFLTETFINRGLRGEE